MTVSSTPVHNVPKITRLPASRLFDGLAPSVKTSFLAEGHVTNVQPNVRLCSEGQRASNLFLLTKGQIKYYRLTSEGKQVILYWLEPGDVFGLGTLLPEPLPYIGSADSISTCEVVSWNHVTMRQFAMAYPQLACNTLGIVLHYLALLADRHSGVLGSTANDRIAKALLSIGDRKGNLHSTGVEIDITNEELASLADVSPFTVSRVLSDLRRKCAVTKRRKGLRIDAPEALLPARK